MKVANTIAAKYAALIIKCEVAMMAVNDAEDGMEDFDVAFKVRNATLAKAQKAQEKTVDAQMAFYTANSASIVVEEVEAEIYKQVKGTDVDAEVCVAGIIM
jgi:hypothetical protein